VYVGRTLLPHDRHRDLYVRVINTTASQQTIADGTCLGKTHTVEVLEPTTAVVLLRINRQLAVPLEAPRQPLVDRTC